MLKRNTPSQDIQPKDVPLPKRKVRLGPVEVSYTDMGEGDPILFVHGIPTSSYLWRNVIRDLGDGYRAIAPDLMGLGDTRTPLEHRFDMEAQADKLLELVDFLGLDRFTLVCHDQGGAAAQWLAVHNPDRIERFIITNCVCYDNWPVTIVANFMKLLSFGPASKLAHRFDLAASWAKSPVGMRLGVCEAAAMSDVAIDEYIKFSRGSYTRFEEFRRFALAGDYWYSVEAAKKFGDFERPTMIIWAGSDRWLNVSWARRLYDDIAGAQRFEVIPFAGHFFQEEEPALCAKYIDEFMRGS